MSELPEGWTKLKLSEVAEVQMGQSPKGDFVNQHGMGIPFYQGKAEFGKLYPTPKKACTKPTKIAQRNDILMSIRAPVGPTNYCPEESCIGRGLAGIRANKGVDQHYLLHYFRSIEPWMSQQGTGTTFKAISGKFLKDVEILLAPEADQKRIADKLDSVLAKVEAAQARLDKIPTILKRFRQSVLAAATSGELTKDWRERNDNSVSELLKSIKGKVADKKAIPLAEKEFNSNEATAFIPESWCWVRLAGLAEIVSGVAKGSKKKGDLVTLPYLRVANVQRGYLDLTEVKEISVTEKQAEKLYLKNGDILFNEGGDIDKLGRGWIWEGQVDNCIHQNHVFRARVLSEFINPKYISFFGNESAREYFLRGGTQTVNLANLNKTTLSLLPVPVPPYEEQNEIVRRVDELLAHGDTVEKQYNAAKARLDKLTQSILAKAFRGELM